MANFWKSFFYQIQHKYYEMSAEGGVEGVDEDGEGGAGDGAEEGDPGIGPAAVAFVFYRQKGVGQARAEVAGRIYCVAGCSAKRHAYHYHKESDR